MAEFDSTTIGAAKGNPGGYSWFADTSADAPTDASSTLGSDFTNLGYITGDGVVNATEQDSEDWDDWAGSIVKTTKGTFSETYEVTWMQNDYDVLRVVYGDDRVSKSGGTVHVEHSGLSDDERIFVFESLIDSTTILRTVIPRGVLMERGDVSQANSELHTFTAKIKALADSSGACSHEYYYDTTYSEE